MSEINNSTNAEDPPDDDSPIDEKIEPSNAEQSSDMAGVCFGDRSIMAHTMMFYGEPLSNTNVNCIDKTIKIIIVSCECFDDNHIELIRKANISQLELNNIWKSKLVRTRNNVSEDGSFEFDINWLLQQMVNSESSKEFSSLSIDCNKLLFPSIWVTKLSTQFSKLESLTLFLNQTIGRDFYVICNYMKQLKSLNLHGLYELNTLNGISNLKNLEKLTLVECVAIKETKDMIEIFDCKELTFLDVTDVHSKSECNLLKLLANAGLKLPKLKFLNCSGNKYTLSDLDQILRSHPTIEELGCLNADARNILSLSEQHPHVKFFTCESLDACLESHEFFANQCNVLHLFAGKSFLKILGTNYQNLKESEIKKYFEILLQKLSKFDASVCFYHIEGLIFILRQKTQIPDSLMEKLFTVSWKIKGETKWNALMLQATLYDICNYSGENAYKFFLQDPQFNTCDLFNTILTVSDELIQTMDPDLLNKSIFGKGTDYLVDIMENQHNNADSTLLVRIVSMIVKHRINKPNTNVFLTVFKKFVHFIETGNVNVSNDYFIGLCEMIPVIEKEELGQLLNSEKISKITKIFWNKSNPMRSISVEFFISVLSHIYDYQLEHGQLQRLVNSLIMFLDNYDQNKDSDEYKLVRSLIASSENDEDELPGASWIAIFTDYYEQFSKDKQNGSVVEAEDPSESPIRKKKRANNQKPSRKTDRTSSKK